MSRNDSMSHTEPPPPYEAHINGELDGPSAQAGESTQPRKDAHTSWRKKKTFILICLFTPMALFVIIFGAVYGTQRAQSRTSNNNVDNSEANQRPYTSSKPVSHSPTVTPPPSPCGQIEHAMSQPSFIPRDISAATGDSFDIYVWDLHSDGGLWRKELGGEWLEYPNRRFLFAPVAVKTSATTQTAFSVDAFTGWIVWQHFENNQWDHDNWHMLEMYCYVKFTTRPTVVSRSEGRIDVFDVDTVGNVWVVSYDGSLWSEWKMIGSEFGGELAVTSWGEDRIDVIGLGGTKDSVKHISWTPETDWPEDWQDITFSARPNYNEGFSGPMAVSWLTPEGDGIIDVFTNAGSSYHLTFRGGQWADDWEMLPASHEGGEFPNTQSLVAADLSGGNPYAHVISRGTDDCVHHNTLEETDAGIQWRSWDYVWCLAPDAMLSSERLHPTNQLTTYAVMGKEDMVNFLIKDIEGNVLLLRIQGRLDSERRPSNGQWDSIWENLGHGD